MLTICVAGGYEVTVEDLRLPAEDAYFLFDYDDTALVNGTYIDKSTSFSIPPQMEMPSDDYAQKEWRYWRISPLLPLSGWVFVGEHTKAVAVSEYRMGEGKIDDSVTGFSVSIMVEKGEEVDLAALSPPSAPFPDAVVVTCVGEGRMALHCTNSAFSCSCD